MTNGAKASASAQPSTKITEPELTKTEVEVKDEVILTVTPPVVQVVTPEVKVIESVVTQPINVQENNIMSETAETKNPKEIKLKLSNPTKILFTLTHTSEKGERILHDGKLSLTKGVIYKLPIENDTLSTKDNWGIKHEFKVSESVRVLNVDAGIVAVECIVHGFVISDGLVLGQLF